jgi:hypothetical protein
LGVVGGELARWGLLAACLDVDVFSHAENLLRSPPGGFAAKGERRAGELDRCAGSGEWHAVSAVGAYNLADR